MTIMLHFEQPRAGVRAACKSSGVRLFTAGSGEFYYMGYLN